jgi:hypothetical protein
MKRVILVLILALACVAGAVAQEVHAKDGMLMAPGDMALSAGFDFSLGVNAGYELVIGKFDIGKLTFSYGAKAIGGLSFLGGLGFTAGGVGTLHFSWACLDLPDNLWWIENIDSYIGLGLGFFSYATEVGGVSGFGLISHGGSSYFFNPNLAVTVAGGVGGSYIGVLLKM